MKNQKMKTWLGGLALVIGLTAGLAQAQTPLPQEHRGQGYGFAAPVASSYGATGFQAGFGGEGLVYKGLGVGGELSYLSFSRFDNGVGVVSPNVSYHFSNVSKDGKWVPFVTGGYSLYFRNSTASGVNFGGGVTYWMKERVGLRFEVRDQVIALDGTGHFVGFRAGISFR